MYQMKVLLFHSTLMFINPFTVHFKLRGVLYIINFIPQIGTRFPTSGFQVLIVKQSRFVQREIMTT